MTIEKVDKVVPRVIEEAIMAVDNFVTANFKQAFCRVQQEQQKGGCGCNDCKRQSVRDLNDWSEFMLSADLPPEITYRTEFTRGTLLIISP